MGWSNWSTSHTVHHWLAAIGYDGLWDSASPTSAKLSYDDSSGTTPGGSTGQFKDPSYYLYQLNLYANRIVD